MSEGVFESPREQFELPRNPRRRQRADLDDGTSPRQQPQRKRSKVAGGAFQPASGRVVEGNARKTRLNGHTEEDSAAAVPLRIPLREKPKLAKRRPREDGGILLVSTALRKKYPSY